MTVLSPRILSWQQLVLESDPDWQRSNLQPWIYSFSNTRLFYRQIPAYGIPEANGLVDDGGFLVLDAGATIPNVDQSIPNQIFSNGGFLMATNGTTYQIGKSIFFPCTLDQLMLAGPQVWPTVQPTVGTGQVWNQAGFACIA